MIERTLRIDLILKDGLDSEAAYRVADYLTEWIIEVIGEIPEVESVEGTSWGPTADG